MRVLLISYDGMLEPLGQSQVLPYVRGLAARGAAMTVLSFEKRFDLCSRERVAALREELGGRGIRWVALRYHKRPTVLATSWDVLVGLVRAFRIVRAERIELIHARSYVAALIGWLLKRATGVRWLFATIAFWVDERADVGFWRQGSFLYRVGKRLERRFFEEADEITTLTERARRIIEMWPGLAAPRVTAIPTCVDLVRFAPRSGAGLPGEAPVFIYTGSVGTYYAFDDALRFVAAARRRWPGARFLALTRQREEVAAAVRRAELPLDTVMVASASYADVPRYLEQAHAGLAFYQPGFVRQGTCPTKVGEYLAMGLPAVVNGWVGDMETLVGERRVGAVLPDCTEEAFERALDELETLWADPARAARCRQVAERHFSLERGVERYWEIYRRLGSAPASADPMAAGETSADTLAHAPMLEHASP